MSDLYPELEVWLSTWELVKQERRKNPSIPEPPKFLILAGWHYSSDSDKATRWREIKAWAHQNNLNHLMPEDDVKGS